MEPWNNIQHSIVFSELAISKQFASRVGDRRIHTARRITGSSPMPYQKDQNGERYADDNDRHQSTKQRSQLNILIVAARYGGIRMHVTLAADLDTIEKRDRGCRDRVV